MVVLGQTTIQWYMYTYTSKDISSTVVYLYVHKQGCTRADTRTVVHVYAHKQSGTRTDRQTVLMTYQTQATWYSDKHQYSTVEPKLKEEDDDDNDDDNDDDDDDDDV